MLGQAVHRVVERGLEVHAVGIREGQDRPQAVGELVRQRRVQVVVRPDAGLALHELGQVPDVPEEAQHQLLPGPRTPVPTALDLRVPRADRACPDLHVLEFHGPMLGPTEMRAVAAVYATAARSRTGATDPIPASRRAGRGSSTKRASADSTSAVAASTSTVLGSAMSVRRAARFTSGPNTSPNRDSTRPQTSPTRT